MSGDPIVAEVRAIRDKLAAACGYDVHEIFRRIRQRQAESGREYLRYPPRRAEPQDDVEVQPAGESAPRDDHGS